MLFHPRTRLMASSAGAFSAAILALVGGPAAARAGAWLQEPGAAYVRLTTGVLSTRERFDPNGDAVPFDGAGGGFRNTRYEDVAATVYAEMGLRPGWNLVTAATWKLLRAHRPSAVFETHGASDATVGVKRGLWRGARGVAVEPRVGHEPGVEVVAMRRDAGFGALPLAVWGAVMAMATGCGHDVTPTAAFRDPESLPLPTEVAAHPSVGSVNVTWPADPSIFGFIDGFYVYRAVGESPPADGAYVRLNRTSFTESIYVDDDVVDGVRYWYRLISVSPAAVESVPTEASWIRVDSSVEPESTYVYRVTAVDDAMNESERGDAVSVIVPEAR